MDDGLYLGDCLDLLPRIAPGSVAMVLADLPYGTTQNKWDSVIPLDRLWPLLKTATAANAAIILTASQPFTSALIMSNLRDFKYCWVWDKVNKFSGHLNAKIQPMRITEDVAVFYAAQPTYNPQMIQGRPYRAVSSGRKSTNFGQQRDKVETISDGTFFPRNLIAIVGDERGTEGRIHPTQKPIALFEYMIKTYSNEGDLILDCCAGSGTTAIAAINLRRRYLCFERDETHFKTMNERVEARLTRPETAELFTVA